MKTIGIDLGTTSISVVVLENQDVIYAVDMNSESWISQIDKTQDVNIITSKAKALLDECLEKYNDIAYIGLTGQMHGIVRLDKNGNAISPLYTWQHQSPQSLIDHINQYTKHKVASGYGLVTHIELGENENVACICTIMDYLGMLLTNRKTPLCHESNSASLGFWDLEKHCFEVEILKQFGVNESMLPQTTSNIVPLGKYQNIPVLIALGDNQASVLGSIGTNNETVLVNMGTGGQVSMVSKDYKQCAGLETRPFIQGDYLVVGASLCGGRAYAILENFFRQYVKEATGIDMNQYEVMERIAKKTELSVSTTFNGTRLNPNQLGEITNISEANFTPGDLVYGLMHGMILELFEMYQFMNIPASSLMVSGNGMRKNQTLQKITAQMFGLPLTLSKYEQEAACGAALSYLYSGDE